MSTLRKARRQRIKANRLRRIVHLATRQPLKYDPHYARIRQGLMANYGRDGWPISFLSWTRHIEDQRYRVIQKTHLAGGHWVSTIWLGLAHGQGERGPLIFETASFQHGGEIEVEARYETEADARAGHAHFVAELEARPRRELN